MLQSALGWCQDPTEVGSWPCSSVLSGHRTATSLQHIVLPPVQSYRASTMFPVAPKAFCGTQSAIKPHSQFSVENRSTGCRDAGALPAYGIAPEGEWRWQQQCGSYCNDAITRLTGVVPGAFAPMTATEEHQVLQWFLCSPSWDWKDRKEGQS